MCLMELLIFILEQDKRWGFFVVFFNFISNNFKFQPHFSLFQNVLKGIDKKCDIGLFSLFEHYGSCKVLNNEN